MSGCYPEHYCHHSWRRQWVSTHCLAPGIYMFNSPSRLRVLTGVACHDTVDCCQRDVSILKSYRTAQAEDACGICWVRYQSITQTNNCIFCQHYLTVVGFDSHFYQLDEQAAPHQLAFSTHTYCFCHSQNHCHTTSDSPVWQHYWWAIFSIVFVYNSIFCTAVNSHRTNRLYSLLPI